MTELPDNLPLLVVASWVIGPGIWLLIVTCWNGDIKRVPWGRLGQCAMVCLMLAGLSQAQAPAQAQQDSAVRRIEKLEDQSTGFTATNAKLETIIAQQKDMLQQLIATNAKQDERIDANSDALQKIAVAAQTIKDTQDQFASRVTWVGSILTVVVIVAGFALDRIREKRMSNGHSPWAKIEKQLEEQAKENQQLMREMMKALQARAVRAGRR